MKLSRLLVLLGLCSLLPRPLLAAPSAITPERLPVHETSPAWEGSQIVSADRAGNVFFFRGDSFTVYPVEKSGSLGEPVRLKTTLETGRMVHDAVLSPGGSEWLVYADAGVRLFKDGQEKAVTPIPWKPWSIAFLRNSPVVAVLPLPTGGLPPDRKKLGTPPRFLRLDGDRWNVVADLKGAAIPETLRGGTMNEIVAEQAVYLAADRRGRLWTAGQYRYRVEQLTPTLRPGLEVLMDGGGVRKKDHEGGKAIEIRRSPGQNPREATSDPQKEKTSYHSFTAEATILDITVGWDGKLYLLTRTSDGDTTLDRFDPALSILERITLQLKAQGRFTIASGKDGLYLAAWNGKQGRWRLDWSVLDQAPWKEVEGYEVDGLGREKRDTL